MKTKILKNIFLSISVLTIFYNHNSIKPYAAGKLLQGSLYRNTEGSNYWHTSNLREWLNSEGTVNYTNQAPTSNYLGKYAYDKDLGFLSNFSSSEKDTIAITSVPSTLTPADAVAFGLSGTQIGGVFNPTKSLAFNIPNLNGYWNTLSKRNFNDKVFVLSPKELINYYQQRGWDILKEVTPEVRQKYSITTTTSSYHTRAARTEGYSERILGITTNPNTQIAEILASSSIGVVPAMHLKPNKNVNVIKRYNINNNDKFEWIDVNEVSNTSNLNIGDIISFGTYLGKPIAWRVVNISETGYPLISAENVLDIRAFDTPGDYSYELSNIEFSNSDVTLNENYFRSVKNTTDVEIPNMRVLNETEMYSRKNGSFTISLGLSDNVGLSKIVLPDGNVIKNPSSTISYTAYTNGYYLFELYDTSNNVKYFVVPVGNINVETSAMVTQSTSNWTNQNVNVDIFASNDVNFTINSFNLNGRDAIYNLYPNYTSYAGKKFKISADVELLFANKPVENFSTGIGFYYYYTTKNGDDYVRGPTWVRGVNIPLWDLQQNGKKHVEFEFTVPGNYFNELRGWSQIDVDHSERAYSVKYSNVKYELLDNTDFAITKIELPNGQAINNKQYSYAISQEGELTHKYKIYDNRNMITEKSITTKIDKANPYISYSSIDTTVTNQNVSSEFVFSDDLSGIKEIVTPFEVVKLSGQKQYKQTVTFERNGVYSFKLIDLAGNEVTQNVTISSIDKTPPTIDVTKSFSLDKTSGTLNIAVTDNVGIKEVILPNNERTSQGNIQYTLNSNGKYIINALDLAGNKSSKLVDVIELQVIQSPSKVSRIEYKLEGATVKDWTTYTNMFEITNEGITTIRARAYDSANNVSSEKVSYVKIDKTKPINNSVVISLN